MATRTVKARVELDGEKEYKAALTELNQGNKVLASEMRKLQAEYKGNSESTEFLTKKGELLERQLLQQKDKVDTLRAAMQKAAETYGESDARTQKYAVQLHNAEAAQYDLEHAIEENDKALKGENTTMQGLGDTVQQLAGKLGIQLPEGATKALNGMNGLSSGTVAAMGAAVAAVAALFEAVKKLHQMTLEAAHDVDDLITKSMTSGVSQQTLQQWSYASDLIDVSVDTMTGSLSKLTRGMADANSGNEELAASFASLGVSITDNNGELRNAEGVFYEVIDALGQVENQTERDAATMALLGKSAQDLNPLILAGSDALRELGEEAEATGYVLDESQIKKLGEVDDAYQRLQLTIEANRKQLAAQFAPASKEAMELFSKVVKSAGDTLIQSGLLENVASILTSIMSIFDAAGSLFDALPSWMNPLNQISGALRGLATLLATIADASNVLAGILIPTNWGSGMARTALGWNVGSGQLSNRQKLYYGDYNSYGNAYSAAAGGYTGNYFGYNASGNDNWRGGLTWVGESGPELAMLPRGTQILSAQASRQAGGVVIESLVINADVRQLSDLKAFLDQFSTAVVRMR